MATQSALLPQGARGRGDPSRSTLRARLVRAGLRSVEQSGAAKLSLRQVASMVGVSHMGPYSHFRNRADLLCAIAAAGFSLLRRALGRAAATRRAPDDKVLACGSAYVAFARTHPQLLGLMFGGLVPPREQTEELSAARGRAFAELSDLVAGAQAQGRFRAGSVQIMTLAGWSIAHGFTELIAGGEVRAKLGVSNQDAPQLAAKVLNLLIDGLSQPPAPIPRARRPPPRRASHSGYPR